MSGNAADRGKVVEHRQYDSFGKVLARTANLSPGAATLPGSGVGVAFGYTGRPLDEKTGLSDYRARWYDASMGRFINEDPSGFKGGDTNLFRYVGNDPLDRIDPSGLTAKWAGYGGKGSVPAAGWGAYGAGTLLTSGAGNSTPTPFVMNRATSPTTVESGWNSLSMAAPTPSTASSAGSFRSQLFAAIDKWPTRGDTGYSAIDVPKAAFASLVGNAVAKPAVYFGTYWRRDTMVENTNAILARNAAINGGRPMGTASALVQSYAGATTDNIAFGLVRYDPVQNRAVGMGEAVQRVAGGSAAFAATFIPLAGAVAPRAIVAGVGRNATAVTSNPAHNAATFAQYKAALGQASPGTVVVRRPIAGATLAQEAQIREYVSIANLAVAEGYMASTGRVSTQGQLRAAASRAAAQERKRAAAAGVPYRGVVGHAPDTTWTGRPVAPFWIDMEPSINSSIGRQALDYPRGYQPKRFIFEGDLR